MRLERLRLRNFRCFDDLTVRFDEKLTVIIAENGAGKTAILDAIAIGFGRYLTKLPGVAGRTTKDTDLRINTSERREPFMMLAWEARDRENNQVVWSGGRKRDSAVTTAVIREVLDDDMEALAKRGLKQIDEFALRLIEDDTENRAYFLPVIAYYGTNRAIRDEVQRRRGFKKQFSRFEALVGALEPDSRFRAAFEWFNAMEDQERREKEAHRDFDYRLPELDLVRNAIVRMLPPGFSRPRTETRPLRFVIDRLMPDGATRTLRISQLSDGYRVVLGLVMDLARRMAQANTQFSRGGNSIMNPLDLPAIALIDEVDLHLHPEWQQRVLADLMQTFPGTQFIVTTHSPQVLSTVPRGNIRILEQDESGSRASIPDFSPLAHESGDALAKVMGTHREPPLPLQDDIRQYEQLVRAEQEQTPEAQALRTKLDIAGYQFHESDLATWRFLAARKTGGAG